MPPSPPSDAPAPPPEPCSAARLSAPHGAAAGVALSGPSARGTVSGPGTPVAHSGPATMRRLRPILLGFLLLLPAAQASARRCGDDVDGRAVACDCGDLLVSSRTLGDEDPITTGPCPGSGLLVDVPPGRPATTLALGGHVLAGSGRGIGIQVLGGGTGGISIVGPGAVRGFGTGILAATGGLATLSDVT